MPPDVAVAFTPDFLTRYRPVGFLGKGGMGAVFLMKQVALDRHVAVKFVKPDLLTEAERRRLAREAKLLASVSHPGILAVHDVGEDGGTPYMVCEYVAGETLAGRLARGPKLTLTQSLRIAAQLLGGLRAAHKQGVTHRDVKPANVLLTEGGKAKLADFGLARSHDVPSGTVAGKIAGTPAYMSPEQCRGSGITAQSDLYAVGVILYEMVTGERPFIGPTLLEYLTQHTGQAPRAPRALVPDLPEPLEALILSALAKDPGARPDGAGAFRKALLAIQKGVAPPSEPRRDGPAAPAEGTVLGQRYRLVRLLGEGGMGRVWLAHDQVMDGGEVAIKILPPELWRDPEGQAGVKHEARLSQKLAHPNIVRLANLEPGDPPYLVMEHVAGPTLAAELARRRTAEAGPYTPAEALPIVRALADALDHAHAQGVVHRDVKPSNVLLGPATKLGDFGIAAELTSFQTRHTGTVPAGTLSYMSPEQLACQPCDARADVYALAATAYQMLTLAPPFAGGDVAWAIKHEPVPRPRGVTDPVAEALLRGLSKDRNSRPGSAGAFAAELERAVRATPRKSPQASAAGWSFGDFFESTIGLAMLAAALFGVNHGGRWLMDQFAPKPTTHMPILPTYAPYVTLHPLRVDSPLLKSLLPLPTRLPDLPPGQTALGQASSVQRLLGLGRLRATTTTGSVFRMPLSTADSLRWMFPSDPGQLQPLWKLKDTSRSSPTNPR